MRRKGGGKRDDDGDLLVRADENIHLTIESRDLVVSVQEPGYGSG